MFQLVKLKRKMYKKVSLVILGYTWYLDNEYILLFMYYNDSIMKRGDPLINRFLVSFVKKYTHIKKVSIPLEFLTTLLKEKIREVSTWIIRIHEKNWPPAFKLVPNFGPARLFLRLSWRSWKIMHLASMLFFAWYKNRFPKIFRENSQFWTFSYFHISWAILNGESNPSST